MFYIGGAGKKKAVREILTIRQEPKDRDRDRDDDDDDDRERSRSRSRSRSRRSNASGDTVNDDTDTDTDTDTHCVMSGLPHIWIILQHMGVIWKHYLRRRKSRIVVGYLVDRIQRKPRLR